MRRYRLALTVLLVPLCGCSSLFQPSFLKKMKAQKQEFLDKHPDAHWNYNFQDKKMHAVRTGKPGRTPVRVILVHGSPGEWGAWSETLLDPILNEQAELVAVDRPGFGDSEPGRAEISLANQADSLSPLLLDPPGRNILVGHSFGGPVIVEMALRHPEKVDALLILAGSVSPELEVRKWYQYPARWLVFRWLLPNDLDVCNEEIFWLKGELEKQAPKLSRIRIPTTVIQGGKDDLVPPGNAGYVREHFTHANPTLIEVAEMNHFIPWLHYPLVQQTLLKEIKQARQRHERAEKPSSRRGGVANPF